MIFRLQKLFEWDIHFMDATESISSMSFLVPYSFFFFVFFFCFCACLCVMASSIAKLKSFTHIASRVTVSSFCIVGKSDDIWAEQVVNPAEKIIRSFLNHNANTVPSEVPSSAGNKILGRDLWTQYICEVRNTY